MLLALLASCISPAALGAVPDDHKDDTPAFQRAIDQAIAEHAEVCIPPGVWNLARPPGRVGSLELTGGPIAIRGAGPGTVLRMTGPGNHRTWAVLYAHDAHDVVIRDLTIDVMIGGGFCGPIVCANANVEAAARTNPDTAIARRPILISSLSARPPDTGSV